jgi:hypothetical protein
MDSYIVLIIVCYNKLKDMVFEIIIHVGPSHYYNAYVPFVNHLCTHNLSGCQFIVTHSDKYNIRIHIRGIIQ